MKPISSHTVRTEGGPSWESERPLSVFQGNLFFVFPLLKFLPRKQLWWEESFWFLGKCQLLPCGRQSRTMSHEWELITPFCECHTSKLKVLPAWSMIFRRKWQPLSCQTSLATLQDSMVGRNFVWDSTEQALLVMTWGERSRQILDLLSYITSGQGFSQLGGGGSQYTAASTLLWCLL